MDKSLSFARDLVARVKGRVDSTRLCLVVNGTTRKTTMIYMLLCVVLNMDKIIIINNNKIHTTLLLLSIVK